MPHMTERKIDLPEDVYVLLYSETQQAHHIETLADWRRKPTNGYRIVALTETYEQASLQCKERQGAQP